MTGGQGFIGRALISRLINEGHSITAGIRDKHKSTLNLGSSLSITEFHEDVDFLEINSVENFDCIIHLATRYSLDVSQESVNEMIKSNYNLILNLLLGAAPKSTPVIIAGSYTQNSSDNQGPVSVYSLTKEAASNASTFFAETYNLKIIELRIFDTYGPEDNRRKFLDLLIDASISGKKLKASPGEQLIDLVNITDVVDGFAHALGLLESSPPGQHRIFDLASRKPLSLKKLAKLVESITQKNLDIDWGGYPYRKYEMFTYVIGNPLLPNWYPKIDLETGIRDLVRRKENYGKD